VFALLAVLVFRRLERGHLAAILALAALLGCLGAWRMTVENAGRPSPALMELVESGEPVEGLGRFAGVPYRKPSGWRAPFDLQAIRSDSGIVPLRARLLLTTRQSLVGFRYGDHVSVTARYHRPFVQRNPGGFDYEHHLFRQGIDGLVRPVGPLTHVVRRGGAWHPENLVEPIRQWIRRTLDRHLPQRTSAVLSGLLLGDTDRLSVDVFSAFRGSGTLHLLAVSGANVWLVVGVFLWPLRLLSVPRWPRTLILLIIVAAFSFLTRNEPSVVRASLVVSMILVGQLWYRPVTILNSVGAAGALILLVSPAHLFRPGFQLSFAAVIAIAVVMQRCRHFVQGRRWKVLRAILIVALSSAAAGVATMPIVAWHFGTVPVMGVFANLLMVPLAGIITQLAVIMLFISPLADTVAGFLAIAVFFLTDLAVSVARFFSGLPGAVLPWANITLFGVLAWYFGLVLMLAWRFRYIWFRPVVWGLGAIVCALFVGNLRAGDKPWLSIAFLDTGRQRVAAVVDAERNSVWITEEPGIDDDLRQWVIEPFIRRQWGELERSAMQRWRRLPATNCDSMADLLRSPRGQTLTWYRYITPLKGTASDRRCWADRIAFAADTLVLIRDLSAPTAESISRRFVLGSGHFAILPAGARDRHLRTVIDALKPSRVLLYGRGSRSRFPDQRLAFWRLRYPETTFWSSDVHGGVVIDIHPSGIRITPTIPEPTDPPPSAG
jgi:ComEC/Rec2-related protein